MESRSKLTKGSVVVKLAIGLMLLLGLVSVWYLSSKTAKLGGKAAAGEVKVTAVPHEATLPTPVKVLSILRDENWFLPKW